MAEDGPRIGKAYVQIIPTTKGIKKAMEAEISGSASEAAEKEGHASGSGFAGAFAKALAAGTAAIGAAAIKIGKEALSSYADYEQLVGGVETLFGLGGQSVEEFAKEQGLAYDEALKQWQELTKAQRLVTNNADAAFRTAGLSANEYMETVTGFAASLISSVSGDTEKAAKLADQAIVDMSDNANKMGSSMESIQNAYSGFAKQNYTMLDNLKLGYGGTKEEMQRLLEDAQAISGIEYDISSYADIVNAIHVIQTEMGITGTTAKEAEATISGSLGMLKASFKNLITDLGDGGSVFINGDIENVIGSLRSLLTNVTPIIENITAILPEAAKQLLEAVIPLLPEVITPLLTSVVQIAVENLPLLIEGTIGILTSLGAAVIQALPALLDTVYQSFRGLLAEIGWLDEFDGTVERVKGIFDAVKAKVEEVFPGVKESVVDAFDRIKEALSPVIEFVQNLIDKFSDYVSSGGLANDATDALTGFVDLLADGISGLSDFIATAVEKIMNFVTWLDSGSAGAEALKAVVFGLTATFAAYKIATEGITMASKLMEAAQKGVTIAQKALNLVMEANPIGIVIAAVTALVAAFVYLWNTNEDFRNAVIEIWGKIKDFLVGVWDGISGFFTETIPGIVKDAVSWFQNLPDKIVEVGKNMITGLWNGIKSTGEWIKEKISGFCDGLLNGIKGFFGIHSPSTVMADIVGKNLALGIGEGFSDSIDTVSRDMAGNMDGVLRDVTAAGDVSLNARITRAAQMDAQSIGEFGGGEVTMDPETMRILRSISAGGQKTPVIQASGSLRQLVRLLFPEIKIVEQLEGESLIV